MKSTQTAREPEQIIAEEPGLLEKLKDFAQTNVKLYKYKAIDKGTEIAALVVSVAVMVVFFIFGFIILSAGLALLVGKWLGSYSYGFFVIGGVYFLLGLLFFLFRNSWIKSPLISSLSKKLM